MTSSKEKINSFLLFNYNVFGTSRFSIPRLQKFNLPSDKKARMTECQNLFQSLFEEARGNDVVFLSGGLDSRAILCGIMDQTDPGNIDTITFGTPGTYDFDIGQLVAKKMGVRNHFLDLTKIEVKLEPLIKTAKSLSNWTYLFDSYFNRQAYQQMGFSYNYWSGFLGDPVAGSHQPKQFSPKLDQSYSFIESNTWQTEFENATYEKTVLKVLSELQVDPAYPSFAEQLDFNIRQRLCILPILAPPEYNVRLPFFNTRWIEFFFSLPHTDRSDCKFYREFLIKTFPRAFSLPCKNNFGAALNASSTTRALRRTKNFALRKVTNFLNLKWTDPNWNYLDYPAIIRESVNFQSLLKEALEGLDARRILDFKCRPILESHVTRSKNYWKEILCLASLEVYLRSEE